MTTPVGSDGVVVDDKAGVRTITLSRPDRKNALDWPAWCALRDVLEDTSRNSEARVVILTGAGGSFCAGADISKPDARHPAAKMRILTDVAMALHDLQIPTIAKVTGVAVGAGWNLALGCDLVVATPDARFSQIFSRRGLSMDLGGSWLLPKLVGLQQAKRLALFAEMIDAAEAHTLGLVTWVVSADEIDAFVVERARHLADGPPIALAQIKMLLNEGASATLRDALAAESLSQVVNFGTSDVAAAYAAFAQKKDPVFTGRWAVPPPGADREETRSERSDHA
ncbi:enoyl-CoA hydratase/isomerase family protein [Gordonia rhizosphera]|uniref:Putative enoyl-CoA hydratase n=1 Tax=Gordonia rhizosphera NBRC 16068 TaxID=1108045 RepID=K6WSY9_9ACTN|nr:enoyl-CoA hydratase-related protein [Gordonia rhizosphera]GAB89674.1 putative enoyl-CoA hydratase [Gordonia rhizosphera NBRC 16068]